MLFDHSSQQVFLTKTGEKLHWEVLVHYDPRKALLGLLGYSKGDELSLAMAAFLKNITAICFPQWPSPGNRSLIPVEKAEAQLLFITGQDDHVVKRKYYATEVCKLLQAQGKENFQILSYPGTGHCIDPTFFPLYPIGNHPIFHKRAVLGEEFGTYSKAQVHAWPQIQAFFQKYLNDK
ncbi:PREDICTED: putative acyl-coenzyme A thioesterase 6 [Lepidothrix coronata]|uniref:Acyl-coenzyme A thioesterase 6 n=1 Tax=Lepidothrix coronata TaxID=321398 RepID=A0A6J0GIX9_9PASS|nr:PREDICTED: putative acyl-coenzyme A thioesterase 6 [Lepidothrix coronata]